MEESVRMTEDRDKWRKYVHGVTEPRLQNRVELTASAMTSRPGGACGRTAANSDVIVNRAAITAVTRTNSRPASSVT